jgi:hypothetical protein
VLHDQSYHTPQGVVINGYGLMVERWVSREVQRSHFINQKSCMKSAGIEPKAVQ